MSDEKFDSLVDELKQQKPDSELLKTVGWGYDVKTVKGTKAQHKYGIVGSLNKIHDVNEIPSTFEDELIIPAKLDGASCVAYYSNGKLVKAVSRGNGTTGIDCTQKYQKIVEKNKLNLFGFTGAVRGEIVFSNTDWENYLIKYPDAKFPRNTATGLFMRDDATDDLEFVRFVAYKIHGSEEYKGSILYTGILGMLSAWGFDVVPARGIRKNKIDDKALTELFEEYAQIYPVDGLVLQNNIVIISTNGQFIYKDVAYKFKAEEKETTVIDVEWNLSKNNIMVPVVNIEPVELSGATVRRASGFNAKYILNNKITCGTRVKVCRANEVIPKITEVLP